jgi:hypothetical protein
MSDSESTPREQQNGSSIVSGASGVTVAVIAACLLFGGCVLCGGGLSLPLFVARQRHAEEAVRRAQAKHNLHQIQEATRTKAEQDAFQNRNAVPAPGNPADSAQPE